MTSPILALRRSGEDPEKKKDTDSDTGLGRARGMRLVCRTCGRHLSDAEARFVMSGSSATAVFANPHGRVFEIVTVRDAWGLSLVGPPTREFSWFAGYAWRVALCAGCVTHVGWSFQAVSGADPGVFYGLLTSEIAEQGDR